MFGAEPWCPQATGAAANAAAGDRAPGPASSRRHPCLGGRLSLSLEAPFSSSVCSVGGPTIRLSSCFPERQAAEGVLPVSSNERSFLLKLLFDTLFVRASVFWANERHLVFER